MPADRRTRPGAVPVAANRVVQLAVGGGRRMDDETADVADVGEVTEQFDAVDEPLARLDPVRGVRGAWSHRAAAARTGTRAGRWAARCEG
ncbi:hypothetical protein J2X68_001740 [Streptomyces sp. 3330]|nr:hypothetical protein [Streptomyces sp. 3330]